MKRTADDDDEEAAAGDTSHKRMKSDTRPVPREFEERSLQPAFRTAHHPESLVTQMINQRESALKAFSSFVAFCRMSCTKTRS